MELAELTWIQSDQMRIVAFCVIEIFPYSAYPCLFPYGCVYPRQRGRAYALYQIDLIFEG